MIRMKLFTATILLFSFLAPLNFIRAQSDWKYDAALYGWLAGMEGTVGIANQEEQIQAKVSDLLKNLTFTAGGHFEVRNPKISLIADVFYVGLKEDAEAKTIGDTSITPNGSAKLDEWIIEGAGGYRVSKNLELLLACRVYSINAKILRNDQTLGSANKSWADVFIGARYSKELSKKWYASVRGDIGLGGSSFAWFINGALGYRFSKLFSLALDYRVLSLDYDTGSGAQYFEYDITMNGFGLGFIFSF